MLLIQWSYLHYKPHLKFFDILSFITQPNRKNKSNNVSRLTDLPDEILLIICEYLGPIDALRAFLSNDNSDRFHRLIVKYRTNVDLSVLSYSDFRYMIDTILPQLDPSDLKLSNLHIPCLTEMFMSARNQFRSMKISSVELRECKTIDFSLISWLSSQSKLEVLDFIDEGSEKSLLTSADLVNLREFLFIKGLPANVTELALYTSVGLVLHNQLKSSITSQITDAFLQLETIDDLQILLNNGLLGNIAMLHVCVKQKRPRLNGQESSSLFLHQNLLEFLFSEVDSGITSDELVDFIRHMPVLNKLFVYISQTRDKAFARYSYVEDLLPNSIVEFQYFARFDTVITDNIDDNNAHRFLMKIHDNMIYTVPWGWFKLVWPIPVDDYEQFLINNTKWIYFPRNENENEISMDALQPWSHVTTIETKMKLSSLALFWRLRILKTKDSTVVHSILPPTLRVLKLTDITPLNLNAPLSTLVHSQVYKFILKRPICNEQDLLNVLHQFPNVRFLSITLPSINSVACLSHIFHRNNARLPHLICLRAYEGESSLWRSKPFEWLITNTPLKYRTTPFHTKYCFDTHQLIIWL